MSSLRHRFWGRRREGGFRKVAIIPSLFTLGNGVCGFASIIVASRINPAVLQAGNGPDYAEAMWELCIAGWLIFAGMVFDVLDGHVARLSKTASDFGAQLDSLCDVISFGAAPAFLLLKLGPTRDQPMLYKALFLSATFYVVCTILRLARFTIETSADVESHRFFKGLPSPAAAGCLASIAVMRYEIQDWTGAVDGARLARGLATGLPFAAFVLALLMVSTFRYPHLVNRNLRGRRSFQHLVGLLVAPIIVILIPQLSLVIAFWAFAIMAPIREAWLQFQKRLRPEPIEEMLPQ